MVKGATWILKQATCPNRPFSYRFLRRSSYSYMQVLPDMVLHFRNTLYNAMPTSAFRTAGLFSLSTLCSLFSLSSTWCSNNPSSSTINNSTITCSDIPRDRCHGLSQSVTRISRPDFTIMPAYCVVCHTWAINSVWACVRQGYCPHTTVR